MAAVELIAPAAAPRFNRQLPSWLRRYGSSLLLLAGWEAVCRSGWVTPQQLAAPSQILVTMGQLIANGSLPHNLAVSLARVSLGTSLGVAAGTAAALCAGLSRSGEDVLDAPLQMARTLPHLALIPLFILWFGIGEAPKILLVALGVLFPIYLCLFAGIRGVDPKLIEMARVFGLSHREVVRRVVLPGALPSFFVGLRYALGAAWISLVVGEQINANAGIGFMIMDAREFLRTDIILVGLLTYALLGLTTDRLVRFLERRSLRWRPGLRGLDS